MKSLFIDSNVFVKHLAGDVRAKQLLKAVTEGETIAYINDIVVSEVLYIYILVTTGRKSYELKENPEALEQVNLAPVQRLLRLANILPTTTDIVERAYTIISTYNLLPNDAIIAATCEHYGIKSIATFDKDFKRIPWLNTVP